MDSKQSQVKIAKTVLDKIINEVQAEINRDVERKQQVDRVKSYYNYMNCRMSESIERFRLKNKNQAEFKRKFDNAFDDQQKLILFRMGHDRCINPDFFKWLMDERYSDAKKEMESCITATRFQHVISDTGIDDNISKAEFIPYKFPDMSAAARWSAFD